MFRRWNSLNRLVLYLIVIYFAAVNLISFFVCLYDKTAAKKHKGRIRERTLFLLCALGGSPLMFMTMITIRHKTNHKRFMLGIPLIMVIQSVILILILKKSLIIWSGSVLFKFNLYLYCRIDNTVRVQCFFEETALVSALLLSTHNTPVFFGRAPRRWTAPFSYKIFDP